MDRAEVEKLWEAFQQQDLVVRHLAGMRLQLERTIWLLVMKTGGPVTINEAAIDPLWKLEKARAANGELVLKAEAMEGPTAAQLDALVKALTGSSRQLFEVAREVGLDSFPPAFLQHRIADRLLFHAGTWMNAELAQQMAKEPGAN